MNRENVEMTPKLRDQNADISGRAESQAEEYDESIRILDRMIAISRSPYYHRSGLSRSMEYDAPSLVDEMIQIHCTPLGVETTIPPAGWDALAQDWQRIGDYLRSVMPSEVNLD